MWKKSNIFSGSGKPIMLLFHLFFLHMCRKNSNIGLSEPEKMWKKFTIFSGSDKPITLFSCYFSCTCAGKIAL